jgi:hypothetical protein
MQRLYGRDISEKLMRLAADCANMSEFTGYLCAGLFNESRRQYEYRKEIDAVLRVYPGIDPVCGMAG